MFETVEENWFSELVSKLSTSSGKNSHEVVLNSGNSALNWTLQVYSAFFGHSLLKYLWWSLMYPDFWPIRFIISSSAHWDFPVDGKNKAAPLKSLVVLRMCVCRFVFRGSCSAGVSSHLVAAMPEWRLNILFVLPTSLTCAKTDSPTVDVWYLLDIQEKKRFLFYICI